MKDKMIEKVLEFQRNEITEHKIYKILAKRSKGKNAEILRRIGAEELKHYLLWKKITGKDVKENRFKIFKYVFLSYLFGITFAVKLMENGEESAEEAYTAVASVYSIANDIGKDEVEHENLLVNMIEEEKLGYLSSIVLGLNDALVEITGTLAGLTFALRNSITIGVAGLITGSAASLSMAASEYLSQKAEKEVKNPARASFYTFVAYIIVVLMLVFPYFLLKNFYFAFLLSIAMGVVVILFFSVFESVIQEKRFVKIFLEMILITGSVALISFLIGTIARKVFHIEV